MSGLSNSIENFLKELLKEEGGLIEFGRNDLAIRFDCAPSQINYVLKTRFTPAQGYFIESRRGGSGYIKIIKADIDEDTVFKDLLDKSIGDRITKNKAQDIIKELYNDELISKNEALLMIHATEDYALSNVSMDLKNYVRSDILKNMLLVFLR
ncbi:CtsR family transcriptional regulator [Citroniella saccharovorans]|uniref:CtsR family transcriptional regulator n=1 Tax=Citroniella saccharovorans TaxID=2053367 RepID=A0AAW9MW30_9FIRM|nr:CtsR family transcriptional regulator [Citroniella saccharovorans]MEB3429978.1 CtsR family transcriptional regulator [Citroniella saccharovorans]